MAITSTQVESALSKVITQDPVSGLDQIPIMTAQGGTCFVLVKDFTNLFSNATDMTSSSLNTIDGGKLGYATAIANWKAAGYIS